MLLVVMSRANITYSVRAMARHSHNSTERHWEVVILTFGYLLGTVFV